MNLPSFSVRAAGFVVVAALATTLRAASASPDDPILRAMRDELGRSTAQLQLENLEKPYFIAYRVRDLQNRGANAEFGSSVNRYDSQYRTLTVEVRVGSPALDNTNFQPGPGIGSASSLLNTQVSLSRDDNYDVLRRQLWLATDKAYKQAVEQLSRKRAALENKTRTDETPDFSPEPPATITDVSAGEPFNVSDAEELARELSAVFKEMPEVATSGVSISGGLEVMRYLNSEGSSFIRNESAVSITARASGQAADGFSIGDHYALFRHRWDELPAKAQLLSAMRDLGRRVSAQGSASLLEQYNGPVLFEDQAAAEIFAQAFAPNLVGRKRPVTETSLPIAVMSGDESPFLDKIGARVMPEFLTVVDDPGRRELNGEPLFAVLKVDDEGVPTRTVTLVEKGRLRTLLTSRSPVRGVPKSTGSLHANAPCPSNLLVTATDGLEPAALKAELLKLVQQRGKEYGVIIRRLGNPLLRTERTMVVYSSRSGGGLRIEPAVVAVKVFPDGHEEPLRNVEIASFDTSAFKDIVCAGRTPYVSTVPYRASNFGSSVVSFAVPALLFEDVTLKKPSGTVPKPPASKHPYFDKS